MAHVIGKGRYATTTYPLRSTLAAGQALEPLTAQFWVDSDTPATVRNGSISAPFNSIQEAYDAAVAAALTSVNILIAKSDPAASLNRTDNGIATNLIGLSGPFGPLVDPAYLQKITNITVSGAAACAVSGMLISGDVSAPAGAPLTLESVAHQGDLLAPNSVIFVANAALCIGGASNFQASQISFMDAFSEKTLAANTASAWPANTLIVSTNAGTGANVATNLVDADEAGETFTGQNRRVWPANSITAPRSVTLTVAGAGDFSTGYIDVYEQGFDVDIIDAPGPTTLWTIPAGSTPQRYGFVLANTVNWTRFSAERL